MGWVHVLDSDFWLESNSEAVQNRVGWFFGKLDSEGNYSRDENFRGKFYARIPLAREVSYPRKKNLKIALIKFSSFRLISFDFKSRVTRNPEHLWPCFCSKLWVLQSKPLDEQRSRFFGAVQEMSSAAPGMAINTGRTASPIFAQSLIITVVLFQSIVLRSNIILSSRTNLFLIAVSVFSLLFPEDARVLDLFGGGAWFCFGHHFTSVGIGPSR